MTETMYDTAYLSLAVPLGGDLLAFQREVCQRYALMPRQEGAYETAGQLKLIVDEPFARL